MKNTINIGSVLGTFQKPFIDKIQEISKSIRDIKTDSPLAKKELQEYRNELLAIRAEIDPVLKYINQDIPVITGKVIEIKKYEAENQKDISIFDFEALKLLGSEPEPE